MCATRVPIPRVDSPPVHTTRVWTALRVRGLTTLETDALRVDKSSICPPSSCPGLRRFFGNFHPKQPRSPPPFWSAGSGSPCAERRTGGAAPGGRGAACPTRRSAIGAGRRPGGKAAKRPLCSAPLGGPRYGSPVRTTYRVRSKQAAGRTVARCDFHFQLFDFHFQLFDFQKTP